MQSKYSNTILATIITTLGLGLAAVVFLTNSNSPNAPINLTIFVGLVALVLNQLLGIRQVEANGYRLTSVEKQVDRNTVSLDTGVRRQEATDVATGVITSTDPPTTLRPPNP